MATAPTPENVARMILARFAEMNSRAGHAFLANQITAIQANNRLTSDEMIAGLQYGEEKGWITATTRGGICLTEAGFKEM